MESILADDTFARLPITKDREGIPFPQRTGRLCSNVVLIYRARGTFSNMAEESGRNPAGCYYQFCVSATKVLFSVRPFLTLTY